MSKVFGIGLSRTGTTSLCRAMEILGYRTIHCPRDIVEIAGWCDACADITVSMRYKHLDKVFPESRFIYTTRERESWLNSCESHFNGESRLSRPGSPYIDSTAIYAAYAEAEIAMYGQLEFDRQVWSEAYERHNEDVMSYFKDKKERLLVIDIEKTKDYTALMSFLEISHIPFPHLNRSQNVS